MVLERECGVDASVEEDEECSRVGSSRGESGWRSYHQVKQQAMRIAPSASTSTLIPGRGHSKATWTGKKDVWHSRVPAAFTHPATGLLLYAANSAYVAHHYGRFCQPGPTGGRHAVSRVRLVARLSRPLSPCPSHRCCDSALVPHHGVRLLRLQEAPLPMPRV